MLRSNALSSSLTIREPLLRELVQASAVDQTVVKGDGSGFAVVATIGGQQKVLETARGDKRLFASLDTAAGYLRDLGMPKFEVDMNAYQQGRLRKARPDRAEALKRTRTRLKQQNLEL